MKIAVYTIALNEAQFVERWAEAAAPADYRLVADTGSTDDTVERLRSAGVEVRSIAIKPWRFDHARNAALALLPADIDICISVDMDEVLQPGWRDALIEAWVPGTTRLRNPLEIDIGADGAARRYFHTSRIHQRFGYQWKYPIHEVLAAAPGTTEKTVLSERLRIRHLPDDEKSRGQYLPMLATAAAEDPNDDRLAHYYGRELMFRGEYEAAIAELRRHLSLPRAIWKAERSASMRFIGRCQKSLGRKSEARSAYLQACAEMPDAREPWHDLAKFCMDERDWTGGIWAVTRALAITVVPTDHTRDAKAWGIGPYDIGSICAYYNRQPDLAREWLTKALEMEPENPRLIKNGGWILPQTQPGEA
ncbi:MAG: glycosyl transferase family 2 [Proteobacteria bacterium]|nr:glycosyl transferase family 2 [Pseudomonadota bacterium]